MINSPIDEIKNRLDILEVVGSYIKLQKAGANYRAICPFHSEKKPSFFVSPTRQIWHCFGGCQKGGDIFGFVKEIEGVEFGDALRILAKKAGVELKPPSPQFAQWKSERQRLYEICELAARFFEKQLEASSVGQEAKQYLLGRGINDQSIKSWRLGYSPDTWDGLTDFLFSNNYKPEEIEKAGLCVKKAAQEGEPRQEREEGGIYDRFRGRIIFPICDLNSQVVGFGGRVFKQKDKEEVAKYVNTPATLLYDKSSILYGLDRAKVAIRKEGNCLLVEGYTDAIMSHLAGFTNVVATSGTALTPFQLKILKRYTENLILGFDMDLAGGNATKRGIDLAEIQGFNIKVVRLAEGKDAAELIFKNLKEWQEAVSNLRSIYDFYFESAFAGKDIGTADGKREISKILLPIIKKIPNQIEKTFWIQKLSRDLKVREADILEEMKKVKLAEEIYGLEPAEIVSLPQKSRRELLEERLAILILKSPKEIALISQEQMACLSPKIQAALAGTPDDYFCLKSEIEEIEEKEIAPEIKFCLKEIQTLDTKNKLCRISKDIKTAEGERNEEKTNELAHNFRDTASELIN